MGLDIAFNRDKAIAAGLKLTCTTRSHIHDGRELHPIEEAEYIAWLTEETELVHIPGTEFVTDNGGVDSIVVRANKWGRIYAPLTEWLKANDIEWSEF